MVKVKFEYLSSQSLDKKLSGQWIEVPIDEKDLGKSSLREWLKDEYGVRVEDFDYTYRLPTD